MSEKNIKTRIQNKHDIEANWLRAENFVPLIGEIIVYDIDENYDYERIKIGDGVSNVNALPFSLEEVLTVELDDSIAGVLNSINADTLFLKPQTPIKYKKDGTYIYPLTTVDQVLLEDNTKLNMALNDINSKIDNMDFGDKVIPLGMEYGGTGASTAEAARESLGITPENIGAVDKTKVVNNFTTTEEGYVADARALKTLNDNKVDKTQISNSYQEERAGYVLDARAMKRGFDVLNNKFNMDLLWENGQYTSTFAAQSTNALDVSKYNLFVIRYKLCADSNYDYWGTDICVRGYRGWMSTAMGSGGQGGTYTFSAWRQWIVGNNGTVTFFDCYKNNKTTNTPEVSNDWMIPYQIFGIKGGIST